MLRLLVSTALFALICPRYLAAADSGSQLSGTVQTPSGRPLADAHVAMGPVESRTDSGGHYVLSQLAAGPQQLTVSATGYQKQTLPVNLSPGDNTLPPTTLGTAEVVVMSQLTVAESNTAGSAAFAEKASANVVKETVSGSALTQNGAQDATDALKGTTGVAVTRAADGSNNITIRGFAPSSIASRSMDNASRMPARSAAVPRWTACRLKSSSPSR